MRKTVTLLLWAMCLFVNKLYSQDLEAKIPPKAFFVLENKMENLSKKYTLEELEQYQFVQNEILPDFKKESFEDIGLDFQKQNIIYGIVSEGALQLVSLMPISNATKFTDFMQKNYEYRTFSETNNYKRIDSSSETIAWNNEFVAFINTERSYSTKFTQEEIEEEYKRKKREEAKEYGEIYEEEKDLKLNWREQYDAKNRLRKKKTESVKENRIAQIFSNQKFDSKAHFNERNSNADMYAYFNYEGYQDLLYSILDLNISDWNVKGSQYDFALNAFFEEEQLKIESEIIPKDEVTKEFLKKVYGTKIQRNLLNYLGEEPIAYTSFTSDSRAAIDQYYSVLKSYLENLAKLDKEEIVTKDHIDLLVDGIALLIDEEAVAELLSGDGIFILDDLTEREVEYTAYSYDEEYHRIEEIKTKTELVPDFTLIFSTENEKFMNRILKLPNINKKERLPYTYATIGGIHHVQFKEEYIESIYTAVNDGMVMITTSENKIKAFDKNSKLPLQKSDKKRIKKNVMAAKFDMKRLLQKVEGEFKSSKDKKLWEDLMKNVGEYTFEGKMEGDRFVSEALFGIEGEHKNSFLYIFDIIESIYQAKKKDKVETYVEPVQTEDQQVVEEAVEATVEETVDATESTVIEAAPAPERPLPSK